MVVEIGGRSQRISYSLLNLLMNEQTYRFLHFRARRFRLNPKPLLLVQFEIEIPAQRGSGAVAKHPAAVRAQPTCTVIDDQVQAIPTYMT